MADHYERTIAHLGWKIRPQQAELVRHLRAVASADGTARAVVQAGTGVGKSIAVLAACAEVGRPGRPGLILIHTNGLAGQYVGRDADNLTEATGARVARVIGGANYLCASSRVAVADGVPQRVEDVEDAEEVSEARRERQEWLTGLTRNQHWATEWEVRPAAGHDGMWRCPGYDGGCTGRLLAGCGKLHARGRGIRDADVVVSNYHLATYQALLPDRELLPQDRALVVVDEAHTFPDIVCSLLSARIGAGFGTRELVDHDHDGEQIRKLRQWLFDTAQSVLSSALARGRWEERPRRETEVALPQLITPRTAELIRDALARHDALTRERYHLPARDDDTSQVPQLDDEAGLGVFDVLALLARAAEPDVVPTVCRPPEDSDRTPDVDHRPGTLHLRRADVPSFLRSALGDRAALVSGTIPAVLPARVGWPDVAPIDVGHPFDYARQATGLISKLDGVKSVGRSRTREHLDKVFAARLAQLDEFIGAGGATLVLCASHDDVYRVSNALRPLLTARGLAVFAQRSEGGSESAMGIAGRFRAADGRGVLIGTDSLAVGLDIPGPMLSRVAWWTLPLGVRSPVDDARQRIYPGRPGSAPFPLPAIGSYLDERLRTKVAQGVGRLIRTEGDTGQVLLCDRRFRDHMRGSTGLLDAHLRQIPWGWAPSPERRLVAADA